jgi:DNA-binding NtrC family response regulator
MEPTHGMAKHEGPGERSYRSSEEPVPARVLFYDPCACLEPSTRAMLEREGLSLVDCGTSQVLLEAIVQRGPAVVLLGFRSHSETDLGVLQLVRRVSPDVPLVLLADEGSLEAQRFAQRVRPIYYAVSPVDPSELREALRAALARLRA